MEQLTNLYKFVTEEWNPEDGFTTSFESQSMFVTKEEALIDNAIAEQYPEDMSPEYDECVEPMLIKAFNEAVGSPAAYVKCKQFLKAIEDHNKRCDDAELY